MGRVDRRPWEIRFHRDVQPERTCMQVYVGRKPGGSRIGRARPGGTTTRHYPTVRRPTTPKARARKPLGGSFRCAGQTGKPGILRPVFKPGILRPVSKVDRRRRSEVKLDGGKKTRRRVEINVSRKPPAEVGPNLEHKETQAKHGLSIKPNRKRYRSLRTGTEEATGQGSGVITPGEAGDIR